MTDSPLDDILLERVENVASCLPPPRREAFTRRVFNNRFVERTRGADGDSNALEAAIHTTLREVHALREELLALGAIVNGNQE